MDRGAREKRTSETKRRKTIIERSETNRQGDKRERNRLNHGRRHGVSEGDNRRDEEDE